MYPIISNTYIVKNYAVELLLNMIHYVKKRSIACVLMNIQTL